MSPTQSMALKCDRPSVAECDRCVLNLLHPHLMQTEENHLKSGKVKQLLTRFKRAANHEGVISLTIDGQVQFINQRAEQFLDQYFLNRNAPLLPDLVQQWFKHQVSQHPLAGNVLPFCCLPLRIEQSGQQLIIHFVAEPIKEHYLLLLEERKRQAFSVDALELLGLTKREAEVLFWITKDKSNSGIAKALGCCEGTVRKHLENLYKKLGVQTRIGAVMVALEMLGLLQA